jgi:hypothetical protein
MKVTFLTSKEAKKMFLEPDDYAKNLPLSNLKLVNPDDPTLTGYQKVFLDSFTNFSAEQKAQISDCLQLLDFINIEIKFIRTNRSHALDIPQTRKDAILLSNSFSASLIIHEVYHVISRKYPTLTPSIAPIWGFKKIPTQKIPFSSFILNPDALDSNYSILVKDNLTNIMVEAIPFIGKDSRTCLKLVDEDTFIEENETNYQSLIDNTSYVSHPEEISAEYFALSFLHRCIFEKHPFNYKKLNEFKFILEEELIKNKLIKRSRSSIYPKLGE